MRILLINPPYTTIYGKYQPLAKVGALWSPLGLMYLASSLEGAGHKVEINDLEINPEYISTIKCFKPDIVGITSVTPTYHIATEIFHTIKNIDDSIITIAGGPHYTALPKESLQENKDIDFIIHGEGEVTIIELIKEINGRHNFNKIKGVAYEDEEGIKINERRELIRDLDKILFPARHLIDQSKYLWSVPKKGLIPITSLMTTRGCPSLCSFCSQHITFGRRVRYRSSDNVVQEIEEAKEKYHIDHFTVVDDTLGLNKKRTYELCDAIKDLNITFEGYTRVDVIDKELLLRLKEAGLNRLSFGIESGDQNILDAIRKGINPEQIKKAYEIATEVGLETRGSIILGLPFETKETIKETIKFIKSLKCKQMYVNVGTPFPGTEYCEMAQKGYGGLRLIDTDWRDYRRWGSAVLDVNDLTAEDLIRWQRKALLSFYLRPKQIWYNFHRAGLKAAVHNGWAFVKSFIGRLENV